MNASDPPPGNALASRFFKLVRRLFAGIGFIVRAALILWATLALHFSNLPWAWMRLVLAATFLTFGVWALWFSRRPRVRLTFATLFLGVVAWFISIRPSHDRPWRPEVAVMPRAAVNGDRVRFTGYRNFDYRSVTDFTVRYEEREVSLSHLTSVDLFLSYWVLGPIAHTFVSFNFDDGPPVCVSIETRPEEGEGFSPLSSMFKQFELIYVVGDERDLVRGRTNFRGEDVFLYPIRISPEAARRLFLVYLDRINDLADRPEFYNLLSNNCTINIVRYANAAGRVGWFDIRHLLNGYVDRYLYRAGWVDTTLPFDELRRRSHINAAAESANDAPDFSRRIRANLPGP